MMNQSFIYENSDQINSLIAELRPYPNDYVRVPIGRRKLPMLDRMNILLGTFILGCCLFLFPAALLLMPISPFLPSVVLGAGAVLLDSIISAVVAFIVFNKFKTHKEYKRTRVRDLTYYDLARIVAERDGLVIDESPQVLEPVDDDLDDSTPQGVIFWMRRVQGEGEIVPGRPSYDSLENSIKYLTAIEKHSSYKPSSTLLEGISQTLQRYDSLVNEEIPTSKVVQVLRKIEAAIPKYENVCKQMYEDAIEKDLMDTEIHIETVDTQVEMSGLMADDFELSPELNDSELPHLFKKEKI